MHARVIVTLAMLAACGGAAKPAVCPPPTAPAAVPASASLPPPLAADELARWQAIAKGGPLPAGTTAASQLPALEAMLASPDPVRRDGVAYEVLAAWLQRDDALDAATVAGLRDRLIARTAAEPVPGDGVFARSFAALVLSVVTAREDAAPLWSDAELEAQVAAATAYAAREVDLRGYTGATGWAHAAAHTGDWIKFLGRHPRLTAAQASRLLDALASLVTRRHGARFSHGEDERLAAAARALLRRGLVDDAALDAWFARVAEPIAAGWPDPFDPVLFAAQRNARDLLISTFVALSFDDAPPAARALARLRDFMSH